MEHKQRVKYDPDKTSKDMISQQTAKAVWVSIKVLVVARGVTLDVAASQIGCSMGTLSNIQYGTLSVGLMRLIKRWASK